MSQSTFRIFRESFGYKDALLRAKDLSRSIRICFAFNAATGCSIYVSSAEYLMNKLQYLRSTDRINESIDVLDEALRDYNKN